MRSGLARTSGEGYGSWVKSRNWIGHVLLSPMLAEPGAQMIYSTGNTHLLSAMLTRATGKSTHAFARDKLARPLRITLPPWDRDPRGIYFGGNQMRSSPRGLLRFGALYRNGGPICRSSWWVEAALAPRTRSIFSRQLYGYGWFVGEVAGHLAYFAWGYGRQLIFVVPSLPLTMVTTSDFTGRRKFAHLSAIQEILHDHIVPAAERSFEAPG